MPTSVETCFTGVAANIGPQCVDWLDCDTIVYGAANSIVLAKVENACGTVVYSLRAHSGKVNCVKQIKYVRSANECNSNDLLRNDPCENKEFSESVRFLSGSNTGEVGVWRLKGSDFDKFRLEARISCHSEAVVSVAGCQTHTSCLVVTASLDGLLNVSKLVPELDEGIPQLSHEIISVHHLKSLALVVTLIDTSEADYDKLTIVWAGEDTKVHICLLSNGLIQELTILPGHEDWVRGLDIIELPSGMVMLASSSQDTTIRLWSISEMCQDAYFDADILKVKEKFFCNGSKNYQVVLESVITGHENWVYSVKWKYTDQHLLMVSASMDKTMAIWIQDDESKVWIELIRVGDVGGNTLGLYGAVFSPNGSMILGHGYHGDFHLWQQLDHSNMKCCPVFGGHFGAVKDISWDPEGKYLLSVSSDKTSRIFAEDIYGHWYEVARPQVHGYSVTCVAGISRTCFVSGGDEKVPRIFQAPLAFCKNLKIICDIDFSMQNDKMLHGASVPSLGLSNKAVEEGFCDDLPTNFRYIEMIQAPSEAQLVQSTLWPEIHKLYGHGYEIFAVACHPDGTEVATACKASQAEHANVLVWSVKSFQLLTSLTGHSLTITRLKYSPCGCYLLSVSRDRSWILHHRLSEGCYKKINLEKCKVRHSRIIWCCAWAPDSSYFVTVSRDKKAIAWNVSQQDLLQLLDLKEAITCIDISKAFDNKSSCIAMGTESGNIYLYAFDNCQWSLIKKLDNCCAARINRVLFSPCLKYLASASEDNFLKIFSLKF